MGELGLGRGGRLIGVKSVLEVWWSVWWSVG